MRPVDRYLAALVDRASAVLGDRLIGVYAAGSLALDAFDPDRSDVDVAIVVAAALDDATKRELVGRLAHESLPCPARGLELVVYRLDVARSGTADPGFELELNTGPRRAHRVTLRPGDRPDADGRFWYGLDRSILHQRGRALVGPPAAETFADLAPDDLRRLLAESIRWWLARSPSAASTEDAVLGACRALVRLRSGGWLDKVGAGRWLLDAGFEPAGVVEAAIAARSGGPSPPVEDARALQRRVLDEVEAARRGDPA